MGYPQAAGMPDQETVKAIHELFETRSLKAIYDSAVVPNIANTDHEPDVKKGASIINMKLMPEPIIHEGHQDGQDLDYDLYAPTNVQLLIDKGAWWGWLLPKVTEVQVLQDMKGEWPEHFGKRMGEVIDREVLSYGIANVHAANTGSTAGLTSGDIDLGEVGAPLSVTRANVDELLAKMALTMNEQGIDEDGWFFVFPHWLTMKLQLSNVADAAMMGDTKSILRTPKLGRLAGFDLYPSRQVPTQIDGADRTWWGFFGHKMGLTFASQISELEQFRHPTKFARILRELAVYGRKVVREEAVGAVYMKPA